jgi:putative transposase
VWQILNSAGIDPAPPRAGPTWKQFLANQAHGIIAADYVHLATALGTPLHTPVFTQDWTTQQARNLTTDIDGPQGKLRFLLRDRDTKYSASFDAIFQADNMDIPTSAPQAPHMNAHRERVIRTLRSEVCDHVLILNEAHAREVLTEYQRHYNRHRPHQAREQPPPERHQQPDRADEANARTLLRTRVLNGLINEYRYPIRRLTCGDDFSSSTGASR